MGNWRYNMHLNKYLLIHRYIIYLDGVNLSGTSPELTYLVWFEEVEAYRGVTLRWQLFQMHDFTYMYMFVCNVLQLHRAAC